MINRAGLELIKSFEGFRAKAYLDPVGIWTIGYGTTAAAGIGVTPHTGLTITEAQGSAFLASALDKFSAQIKPLIAHPISENQWAACLSLAYNIGPGAFGKSTVLRKINAGDMAGAADAILLWNKAGGNVLNGLVRRRAAERELFLTPDHLQTLPVPQPSFIARLIAWLTGKGA